MNARISKISLIVYFVLLLFSFFSLSTAGNDWPIFLIMAGFAIVALMAGPKRYRVFGSVAVVFSICLIFWDVEAGKRFDFRRNRNENSKNMTRLSKGTVENLLFELDGLAPIGTQSFELWVPQELTSKGSPIAADSAMAIILEKILGMGFEPDGFVVGLGGRTYRYKAMK